MTGISGECNCTTELCVCKQKNYFDNSFYCMFVSVFLFVCLQCNIVFTLYFSCQLYLLLVRSQQEHLRPTQVYGLVLDFMKLIHKF